MAAVISFRFSAKAENHPSLYSVLGFAYDFF